MVTERCMKGGAYEFRDTREAFDHYFGTYVTPAAGFHELPRVRGYSSRLVGSSAHDGSYDVSCFGKGKEGFIKSMQEIIKARLPVTKGITYQMLQEMVELAMGDWWNEAAVKKVLERGEYLRSAFEERPESQSLQAIRD